MQFFHKQYYVCQYSNTFSPLISHGFQVCVCFLLHAITGRSTVKVQVRLSLIIFYLAKIQIISKVVQYNQQLGIVLLYGFACEARSTAYQTLTVTHVQWITKVFPSCILSINSFFLSTVSCVLRLFLSSTENTFVKISPNQTFQAQLLNQTFTERSEYQNQPVTSALNFKITLPRQIPITTHTPP